MKAFLEGFLPRLLPPEVHFRLIPHEGKSYLMLSIPRKLRGWREPHTAFVVVRDQDSGDCIKIKGEIRRLCEKAGKPETLIRIACRELEAWFIGDLPAVEEAFAIRGLARKQDQQKYRNPDVLGSPSQELVTLDGSYGKVSGARKMDPVLSPERCRSPSLRAFVEGVTRVAGGEQAPRLKG